MIPVNHNPFAAPQPQGINQQMNVAAVGANNFQTNISNNTNMSN